MQRSNRPATTTGVPQAAGASAFPWVTNRYTIRTDDDESLELDAVAAVARITALEMLVRQMMIIQLRILDRMGEI